MNTIKLAIILNLITDSWEYTPFQLTDCSSGSNRLLTINGQVLDYPVEIPGHVRVISSVDIHRPVAPGRLRLDVVVQKWIVFDYFTLPCVGLVGSCSYDACGLLAWYEDNGCPWQLEASNFPCTCPFDNGTYTLEPYPFYIPEVRGPWQWIAFGDFRVIGILIDEQTSEEVACYSVEFTTANSVSPWNWWLNEG